MLHCTAENNFVVLILAVLCSDLAWPGWAAALLQVLKLLDEPVFPLIYVKIYGDWGVGQKTTLKPV